MHEARLWKTIKETTLGCELCSHHCTIKEGRRGKCGVRENREGTLYTLVYDRVAAANLDPIEKKPLYHFMPGTKSFSFGTPGCNLGCSFCQNYSLSQGPRSGGPVGGQEATPQELVDGARRVGAASISYTYSEPTIFFELMQDTARLAVDAGLKNVMVSNGFMTKKCLDELGGTMHAANFDLKAMSEEFYKKRCDARLAPVLENMKHVRHTLGWWLEVTTLLIPELNDSDEELDEMARFVAEELGPDTPWHISRFHPTYKLTDRASTPIASLERAYAAGKRAGLDYVYVGNVPGHDGNKTSCPECGCVCLDRTGFYVSGQKLDKGACAACGHVIAGVGIDQFEPPQPR